MAACENSSGALTLSLPRGVSPPDTIAATVSSTSASNAQVRSCSPLHSYRNFALEIAPPAV